MKYKAKWEKTRCNHEKIKQLVSSYKVRKQYVAQLPACRVTMQLLTRACDSHKCYEKFGSKITKNWQFVHTLSKRHEEFLRLLDLLEDEKEDNKMSRKVVEEKNALIKINSLISLECDEKVEQQTNSLQKLDSYWFAI